MQVSRGAGGEVAERGKRGGFGADEGSEEERKMFGDVKRWRQSRKLS